MCVSIHTHVRVHQPPKVVQRASEPRKHLVYKLSQFLIATPLFSFHTHTHAHTHWDHVISDYKVSNIIIFIVCHRKNGFRFECAVLSWQACSGSFSHLHRKDWYYRCSTKRSFLITASQRLQWIHSHSKEKRRYPSRFPLTSKSRPNMHSLRGCALKSRWMRASLLLSWL